MQKLIFILPVLLLLLSGCGPDLENSNHEFLPHPEPLTSFPPHDIDLEKYGIKKQHYEFDPDIRANKASVIGDSRLSRYRYYLLSYRQVQEVELIRAIEKYGKNIDEAKIEYERYQECKSAVLKEAATREYDICFEEKIVSQSLIRRFELYKEDGFISEDETLESFSSDQSHGIYSRCTLPDEVSYYLKIESAKKLDNCTDQFIATAKQKGFLE